MSDPAEVLDWLIRSVDGRRSIQSFQPLSEMAELVGQLAVNRDYNALLKAQDALEIWPSKLGRDYEQGAKPRIEALKYVLNAALDQIEATDEIKPASPKHKILQHLNRGCNNLQTLEQLLGMTSDELEPYIRGLETESLIHRGVRHDVCKSVEMAILTDAGLHKLMGLNDQPGSAAGQEQPDAS